MTPKRTVRIAAILATAIALPASAQSWYGGFGLGQSITDSSLVSNRESTLNPATNIRSSFDDKDTAFKFFLGYRFNDIIAVEGNYADLGDTRIDTTFNVPEGITGLGGVLTNRGVKGFGLDLVLGAPVADSLYVFGKVGWFRAETTTSAELSGETIFSDGDPSRSRTNKSTENIGKFGVGLDWNFMKNMAARVEWERYTDVGKKFGSGTGSTGEADMDAWTVGVIYRF